MWGGFFCDFLGLGRECAVADVPAADEENGDGPEASDVGTIEVVVLRCNEVPKQGKGRGHRYPRVAGSSSRELSNPTIEPHPHSKHYWKNWAAEEQHDANPPGAGPVCKKDIKKQNLSHRVTTGREEVVESLVSDAHLMFLDSFEKPYCILVMKYRSRSLSHLPTYAPCTGNRTYGLCG